MRLSRVAAFTLVEIAIVVLIIGLVCMIAIPSLIRARTNSQAAAIANDLRVFEGCFDHYAFVNFGTYPPSDLTAGDYPVGMETNWLPATWIGPTPSAGHYTFRNGGGVTPHIIGVQRAGLDSSLISRVDEMIDDGDINTGNVRSSASGLDYYLTD